MREDSDIIKYIKKFDILDNYLKLIEPFSSNMTDIKIKENLISSSKYWIPSQENWEISNGNVVFLKNHNANVRINNNSFTNNKLSLAVIHIVRDPRDVVISFSHFLNKDYDWVIEKMCNDNYWTFFDQGNKTFDLISTWKTNFLSWTEVKGVPRILIRYEDLISSCYIEFTKIMKFLSEILNIEIKEERILFCIEKSKFEILSKYEKDNKFSENNEIKNYSKFFRKGEVGQWRKNLNKKQILRIENTFFDEMTNLKYL
tara:strand:+ start:439 stop:1212 length:774 start_codon:yes stop_codon:yes gene_type:complete